jgi:hypothetical protein
MLVYTPVDRAEPWQGKRLLTVPSTGTVISYFARRVRNGAQLTDRPTSAFACSLIGGLIALLYSIVLINSWFYMYSNSGTTFNYSEWYFMGLLNFTAVQALALFVIGVVCGFLTIFGAVLQYSGRKSSVKSGSIIVLAATVVAIPSTYYGLFLGGILATYGAYVGLTWKPRSVATADSSLVPEIH